MTDGRLVRTMRALDSDEKIAIVRHIYAKGKKSITDVRNELNYNFSTAHKYLNELEAAGILASEKSNEGGRIKKLYSIGNFSLTLSPEALAGAPPKPGAGRKITIISSEGRIMPFDPSLIRKIFISSGVPIPMAEPLMRRIDGAIQNGMTLEDLKGSIFENIDMQIRALQEVKAKVEDNETFHQRKSLVTALREGGHAAALASSKAADYHIRNLHDFYPVSLQHDPRKLMKYGLRMLGLDSMPAKHLSSAVSHIVTAVEAAAHNLTDVQHGFDALNVYLAPYAVKMPPKAVEQELQGMIYRLNFAHDVSKCLVTLGLEQKVPDFLRKVPAPGGGVYGDYEAEARRIYDIFLRLIEGEKKPHPKFMVKIRDRKDLPSDAVLSRAYAVNMLPKWQQPNATYMVDWCRLDSSWSGVRSSVGTTQLQSVVLNMPRAALQAGNDETKALEWVAEKVGEIRGIFLLSAQNTLSQSLTEMPYLAASVRDGAELVKYCDFADSAYPVELLGLREFSEMVAGGDDAFMLKAMAEVDRRLSEKSGLRTGLMELDFRILSERFAESNNRMFGVKHRAYAGGIGAAALSDLEKIDRESKFHSHFRLGHCCLTDRLDAETLSYALKKDVGMLCQKDFAYLV